MMVPRRCGGTNVSVVVISNGRTMAVPRAWTMRAASSMAKLAASAAAAVPRMKLMTATRNSERWLKRWSRNPVVGMTTESVSRKPVVSHWPVAAEICRSDMIPGNATVSTVSLRIIMKAASANAVMTPVICRVDSDGAAGGAAMSIGGCSVGTGTSFSDD